MVQPVIRAAAGLTTAAVLASAVLVTAVPSVASVASAAAATDGALDPVDERGGGFWSDRSGEPDGPALGRVRWRECGDGLRCGKLSVPVDWKRPSGTRTEIDLAWLPARDPARSLGPLVVNTGAGSTVQDVRARPDTVSELARWFDVVLVEPRGIGDRGSAAMVRCSVPPPDPRRLQIASGEAAWRSYARHNAAYDRSCRIAAGPAYDGLTAWQVAHDLDALRDALGRRRLRYFGNGYGAVYGQAYLELFPGRAGRIYLEGVPDHFQPGLGRRLIAHARAAERQLRYFRDWCVNHLACPLDGDAVEVLDDLLAHGVGGVDSGGGTQRTASPAELLLPANPGPPSGPREPTAGSPDGPGLDALLGETPLKAGPWLGELLGGGPSVVAGGSAGGRSSKAGPGVVPGRRAVDERRVVAAVLAGLDPKRWPELARALAAAEEGDTRALLALADVRRAEAPATVSRAMHCHDFMPAVPGYRTFLRMEARLREVAPRVGWLTGRYEVGRCLGLRARPSWPPHTPRLDRSRLTGAEASAPAGGEGRPSSGDAGDRPARTGSDLGPRAGGGQETDTGPAVPRAGASGGLERGAAGSAVPGDIGGVGADDRASVLVGVGRLDVVSPPAPAARLGRGIPGAVVLWHGDGHDAYLLQGAGKLRAACLRARVHDFLVRGKPPKGRTSCPGELTAGAGRGE
ncbi:alpha/beta hydrolase [Nonomuraea sp. NPDC049419]|uniref:alpha/beta hydrolase n=1 Tax=Nonomuraea sp. NPDC049419 TaxID=3155772 RepID=UPI003436D8CA